MRREEKVFDVINSEEKAYWLGFIHGDGSVRGNRLSIEISNKDREHLDKFQKFMKTKREIKETRKNCSVITINSKHLVDNLAKYNIVESKTYKDLGTPKIPEHLLVHYYRGILDSDGWITKSKTKGIYHGGIGFCSYKQKMLLEILAFLKERFPNIKSNVNTYRRKGGKWQVSQLQMGGVKMFFDLYEFFYKEATIYLNRKRDKGIEVCETLKCNPLIGKRRNKFGRFCSP